MNNKTQYFVIKIHKKYKPAILWRIKDNEATVFSDDLGSQWKETDCTVENILSQREMKQITRNEARKLFPTAFKTKAKKIEFSRARAAFDKLSKSDIQKIAEINSEFLPESKWKHFWRGLKEFIFDSDKALSRIFPLIK